MGSATPAVAPAQVGFNSYKVASNSTDRHFGQQYQQPSVCWMVTAIPLTRASTLGPQVNKAGMEASSILPWTITEHTREDGRLSGQNDCRWAKRNKILPNFLPSPIKKKKKSKLHRVFQALCQARSTTIQTKEKIP